MAQTNYLVTVKNGSSTQTFPGTFTGSGDTGSFGAGRTITTFFHAASLTTTAAPFSAPLFHAPQLSVPSLEKLRRSRGRHSSRGTYVTSWPSNSRTYLVRPAASMNSTSGKYGE